MRVSSLGFVKCERKMQGRQVFSLSEVKNHLILSSIYKMQSKQKQSFVSTMHRHFGYIEKLLLLAKQEYVVVTRWQQVSTDF